MHYLAERAVQDHGANHDAGELSMLLELIEPAWTDGLTVEIESDDDSSAWLWHQMASELIVITRSLPWAGWPDLEGVQVVLGSPAGPVTQHVSAMSFSEPCADLVFVTGSRGYVAARRDIDWARTVAPRGLVVVHGIHRSRSDPDDETYLAWELFRARHPHVEICAREGETPGYGILWPAG